MDDKAGTKKQKCNSHSVNSIESAIFQLEDKNLSSTETYNRLNPILKILADMPPGLAASNLDDIKNLLEEVLRVILE